MGQSINYDESKVGTYTLPDPLLLAGRKITTLQEWTAQKRPETLRLFKDQVYGQLPERPATMRYVVRSTDKTALGGLATRKQVAVFFSDAPDAPGMELLLYLPNNVQGPVPAFAGLNFYGNQSVSTDPGILITSRWVNNNTAYGITNHKATAASRGAQASRWPVEMLIKEGFALITAYYGDLEPDHATGWQTGIRTTLKAGLGIAETQWGAIGAWAWGLSRIMDYLQTEPAIDASQVALTGHSRLGKAALWAGANDTRFALVVSNESGEGGAALARRNYGETIQKLNERFPHWFSPAYASYNQQPHNLPVDQHQLLALIAPRPLYVCSAAEDKWADPKGEFLSALHAGPVYSLYNKTGLEASTMPAVNQPVGGTVRYHIRSGPHDITKYDWEQHIAFARQQFNRFTLTIVTEGNGKVTQTPAQQSYSSGTSVLLTATPATGYTFKGWSGDATGTTNPLTVSITGNRRIKAVFAAAGQQVTGFTLINAATDKPIRALAAGDIINVASLKYLNIRANTYPAVVGSVKFYLSGKQKRTSTETAPPYALFGDTNGNYFNWAPAAGSYTLEATPYTGAAGTGTAGTPRSISFEVITTAVSSSKAVVANHTPAALLPTVYPAPTADGRLQVALPEALAGKLTYTLLAAQGRRLQHGTLALARPTAAVSFDFSEQMQLPGMYYLLLESHTLKIRLKVMRL